MNKQLQLVNFEQAKRLREKGFNWYVELYYTAYSEDDPVRDDFYAMQNWNDTQWHGKTSAPTVALALKWFRDEKGLKFTINLDYAVENGMNDYYYECKIEYACGVYLSRRIRTFHNKEAYELAEIELLDRLLTLIEKEK